MNSIIYFDHHRLIIVNYQFRFNFLNLSGLIVIEGYSIVELIIEMGFSQPCYYFITNYSTFINTIVIAVTAIIIATEQ